jgi:proline iminopeptidase
MKIKIATIFFVLATLFAGGQDLYTKAFGNPKDQAVVFLHGGPGYNAASFEATTAQPLADRGFFVIVYDRRGEGRSKDPRAKYTFRESFDDLKAVCKKYEARKPVLIGHSFGGVIATLYAKTNPNAVQALILVGAPVSLQSTFETIIARSKAIYQARNDSLNLKFITLLQNMDATSLEYSSYCLGHAMQNGFYATKNLSAEAKALYARFKTDTLLTRYASQMSFQAPQGFWKNEHYTTIDLTDTIRALQKKNVKVYALFGKDDGLYSAQQVEALQNIIGPRNLDYIDNCSHNVFIDQQTQFMDRVKTWVK